jgi:hypothetical protein
MANRDLTFEEVDRHVQQLNLAEFEKGGKNFITAGAGVTDVLPKLCAIYAAVRPILALIEKAPFLPKKWRDAIRTFMNLMGTICP